MPNVGDPAPLFSGVDVLTGDPFSLADHEGKCVLVGFHGYTWCGPCQFAVPLLQEVWAGYQTTIPTKVQFVVVSVNESPTAAMLQQAGITMPWLVDTKIPSLYGAEGPPAYFFLGHDLRITHIQFGLFSNAPAQQKAAVKARIDTCVPDEPSWLREIYFAAVATILFGVTQDGGGFIIKPGGGGGPVPPWDPLRRMAPEKRDILLGLAVSELAQAISDKDAAKELERDGLKTVLSAAKQLLAKGARAG